MTHPLDGNPSPRHIGTSIVLMSRDELDRVGRWIRSATRKWIENGYRAVIDVGVFDRCLNCNAQAGSA